MRHKLRHSDNDQQLVAKSSITPEDRRRAALYVQYFGSSIEFQQVLERAFPTLFKFMVTKLTENKARERERALESLTAAVVKSAPTVEELNHASLDRSLRKRLRDRFLTAMATAYDNHFPRPTGGPSRDLIYQHEAAEKKKSGATWAMISTIEGKVHIGHDRSRKAVDRDRVILTGACVWLIGNCGPNSNAPHDVQDEFAKLSQAVQKLEVPPTK